MRRAAHLSLDRIALREVLLRHPGSVATVAYSFRVSGEAVDWSAGTRAATPDTVTLRGLWVQNDAEGAALRGQPSRGSATLWVEDQDGKTYSTRDTLTKGTESWRVTAVTKTPGHDHTTVLALVRSS